MSPDTPHDVTGADAPSCLERLRTARPGLTGARARVADTVLADPWKVRGVAIQVLAQAAGVSENAVSRFTHALSYSGYREFAQALSLDLGKTLGFYHSHPVELTLEAPTGIGGAVDLIQRVMALEVECMQDTLANLSEPALRHLVDRLATAPSVLLIGTGTAAPLCQMLCYRLASVGIAVTWTADPMMMLAQVARLRPGDLVLGISYSGRSRDSVQALQYASDHNIETAGLTANPQSPLSEVVETSLTIFSSAVSRGAAQFSARVAGLALLEAIATAVSETRGGPTFAALDELGGSQERLNDLPTDWRNPS
ncbi:MurR/RpiR family transcriptional regulator [Jiangella asiatica]|uniref:MurR/RpiR family transcriptional regulator n=1 Tax=Jiangella asiatica TaxID=2530372 RepID=A0A4R5DF39_9ACTN|nr:MurR/RpiR family transcriptional regulator [Jiangella asiatica]TDE09245.1 MurR/RpiR family transcriptional regulator [Jiangella asiatica]